MTSTETAPKPDADMLRTVLAKIEEVAEQGPDNLGRFWDQGHYRRTTECGTAMCFAGWTGELDPAVTWGDYEVLAAVTLPDGREHTVGFWAQHRLGLTHGQAGALFDCENELSDLRQLVQALIDGRMNTAGAVTA